MKKSIFSLIVIVLLAGCMNTYETVRPGLRAVINDTGDIVSHQTLVNGNWYESTATGELTARGKMDKDAFESSGDDGGGGGGGGC